MIRAGLEARRPPGPCLYLAASARFHERIRLAGDLISEDHLTDILDRWATRPNDGAPITYFEITTVAALLAFAETPADFALLEVGLWRAAGCDHWWWPGRGCARITPVDLDPPAIPGRHPSGPRSPPKRPGSSGARVPCVVAHPQQ